MGRDGLFIGEVAVQRGVSRKALRLYEAAGIVPAPRRTAARYRLYGNETPAVLGFVAQARRLGFTLKEIKQIVSIKRSGRAPRPHVRALVRRKVADLDRTLADLAEVRTALRGLLGWRAAGRRIDAVVCACIEDARGPSKGGASRWLGGGARTRGVSASRRPEHVEVERRSIALSCLLTTMAVLRFCRMKTLTVSSRRSQKQCGNL